MLYRITLEEVLQPQGTGISDNLWRTGNVLTGIAFVQTVVKRFQYGHGPSPKIATVPVPLGDAPVASSKKATNSNGFLAEHHTGVPVYPLLCAHPGLSPRKKKFPTS